MQNHNTPNTIKTPGTPKMEYNPGTPASIVSVGKPATPKEKYKQQQAVQQQQQIIGSQSSNAVQSAQKTNMQAHTHALIGEEFRKDLNLTVEAQKHYGQHAFSPDTICVDF